MGLASLGVSLPKDWTVEMGLEAGSLLMVDVEPDGSIRIDPAGKKRKESRRCRLRVEECKGSGTLQRVIIGSYLLGMDTIEVASRTPLSDDEMEQVYGAVDMLTGMTIVEQAEKRVILESFVEPTKFPVGGLLRRLQYLAERMVKLCLDAIMKPEEGPEDMVRLEEEMDRLHWLITRQLLVASEDRTSAAQIGETDPRHIAGDLLISAMLERVGDVALDLISRRREVALELSAFPKEVSDRFFALGEKVEGLARDTMEAFFTRDAAGASQVLNSINEAEDEAHKLSSAIPLGGDVDSRYCALCLQLKTSLTSMAHICDYYGTVAHLALNRALEVESAVFEPL